MKKIMWVLISSLTLLNIFIIAFFIVSSERNGIENIFINKDDKIVIELNSDKETKCFIGNSLSGNNWANSKNNKCILDYVEDNDYVFLKNKFGSIYKIKNKYDLSAIKKFGIYNNKIYLAIGGQEIIDYYLESIVKKDNKIIFKSDNPMIASVNKNGVVTGNSVGLTSISINLDNYNIKVNVVVTDKIVVPTNEFDYEKKYLTCNEYTKDENDLLDEILSARVAKAGKGTRAAVVEAARFLTLEFPKRISYFGENGRLTLSNELAIDGEGRYYKEGLFLNNSRYDNISKSMYGPKTWGCSMYSYPNSKNMPNGLDCSGFVSWTFINAGLDVGDIGAGITGVKDFTDLGEKVYIRNAIQNKSIVVGDLLSGSVSTGGHIAIVVGIQDGYYYVSESLGREGVVTKKYDSRKLQNFFYWHIDMSEFYSENGLLSDYWIK